MGILLGHQVPRDYFSEVLPEILLECTWEQQNQSGETREQVRCNKMDICVPLVVRCQTDSPKK